MADRTHVLLRSINWSSWASIVPSVVCGGQESGKRLRVGNDSQAVRGLKACVILFIHLKHKQWTYQCYTIETLTPIYMQKVYTLGVAGSTILIQNLGMSHHLLWLEEVPPSLQVRATYLGNLGVRCCCMCCTVSLTALSVRRERN